LNAIDYKYEYLINYQNKMSDDEYVSSDMSDEEEEEFDFDSDIEDLDPVKSDEENSDEENSDEENSDEENSDEEDEEEEEEEEIKERKLIKREDFCNAPLPLTKYEAVVLISERANLIDQGYKTKLTDEERGEYTKSDHIALVEYNLNKFPRCILEREMPNGDILELEFPKDFEEKYRPKFANP
jgi:DNA-directed RNA polymerase subunit K/omega